MRPTGPAEVVEAAGLPANPRPCRWPTHLAPCCHDPGSGNVSSPSAPRGRPGSAWPSPPPESARWTALRSTVQRPVISTLWSSPFLPEQQNWIPRDWRLDCIAERPPVWESPACSSRALSTGFPAGLLQGVGLASRKTGVLMEGTDRGSPPADSAAFVSYRPGFQSHRTLLPKDSLSLFTR